MFSFQAILFFTWSLRFIFLQINLRYYGVNEEFLREFCKCCPVCQQPETQDSLSELPPVTKEFLSHVHVDIIDMSEIPDGEFRYICHFMDHFSELHVLFPLKSNRPKDVAHMLEERVFAYFGVPKTFHSANGKDFVNRLICAMFDRIGGEFIFANGHVHFPHLANRLESSNRIIVQRIEAMKKELHLLSEPSPWSTWLPSIMNLLMRGGKYSVTNRTVPSWLTSLIAKSGFTAVCWLEIVWEFDHHDWWFSLLCDFNWNKFY